MTAKKKHPKDMTSEEAMKHLFSAKGHSLWVTPWATA